MNKWKTILYNISFALNCLLFFLLIFEDKLSVPPWVQTIGRMHPLFLHFPIVLLLVSVFWELFPVGEKSHLELRASIGDWFLLLASITAVTSALMGLFLSKEDGYTQDVLAWHKWGGVVISFLCLGWYSFRNSIRKKKIVSSITALSGFVIVVITGHLGAEITHGDNFLLAPVTKDAVAPKVLFEDAVVYQDMVYPILKSKCITCHNEKKAKGELSMESVSLLLKGGKDGALWDSTQPDLGLMLRRIHLPPESKKHMPPSGKSQLSDEEIAVIYNWIKEGANFKTKVADLTDKDTLRILASSLFNTIETDDYTFEPADENKVKLLSNNYRLVAPLALGSPALGVEFFSAAQFKADQLKELLEVKKQIVSLNLNKMPVIDADLSTIAQFTSLRRLNLSFTDIKGSGLAALNKLQELKQLSLSGTGVNVANLNVLLGLPKLTELYIWSTPAQAENIAALQRQLKNTRIVTGFAGDTVVIKLNKPSIENDDQVLLRPERLDLKHPVKGVTIRYTTDGTDPDSLRSPVYDGDFTLNKALTIKAKAFKQGWISSDVTEKVFYKAGYKIDSIRFLHPAPDPPYNTMSASILTDAQKGDLNFKSGKWIGFRGLPMQALMRFDTAHIISSVTISSLVDIGGYIMPPQTIEIWGGKDPGKLNLVKKISPPQPVKEAPAYMKGYAINFKPVKEKYLKVVIVPVTKLPAWHRGKGDKGWVFTDEIFLN